MYVSNEFSNSQYFFNAYVYAYQPMLLNYYQGESKKLIHIGVIFARSYKGLLKL
jgi:hypothetical protein